MLIDEILLAIDTSGKESLYTQTVYNEPKHRNREICLLLTNSDGLFLFIRYCKSCKKNTIFTSKGTCCCPSHDETKKEYIAWDYFTFKEYTFGHDGPYPVFAK